MNPEKPLIEKWKEEFISSARILMIDVIKQDLEKLFDEEKKTMTGIESNSDIINFFNRGSMKELQILRSKILGDKK